MSWLELTETQAHVVKGGLKGAIRGGAMGATAAIASGAAVVITTPAWMPWIGGSMLVTAEHAGPLDRRRVRAGALTGGAWAYIRAKQRNRLFRQTFGRIRNELTQP